MPHTYSNRELFDACETLFGPCIPCTTDFLKYLRRSGVKAAFRKRALETHPDCFQATSAELENRHERFVRVSRAYQLLDAAFVGNRLWLPEDTARPPENQAQPSNAGAMRPSVYRGQLPRRALRFGQFLYYSKVITWEDLIQALLWQPRRRTRIGEIAIEWKMLSSEEVRTILYEKKIRERFGETALRKGLLTPYNILALVGKQRRLNRSIGQYFVEAGLLTKRQVDRLICRQRSHNRHFNASLP